MDNNTSFTKELLATAYGNNGAVPGVIAINDVQVIEAGGLSSNGIGDFMRNVNAIDSTHIVLPPIRAAAPTAAQLTCFPRTVAAGDRVALIRFALGSSEAYAIGTSIKLIGFIVDIRTNNFAQAAEMALTIAMVRAWGAGLAAPCTLIDKNTRNISIIPLGETNGAFSFFVFPLVRMLSAGSQTDSAVSGGVATQPGFTALNNDKKGILFPYALNIDEQLTSMDQTPDLSAMALLFTFKGTDFTNLDITVKPFCGSSIGAAFLDNWINEPR